MTETEKPYKMSLTEEMRKYSNILNEARNKAEMDKKIPPPLVEAKTMRKKDIENQHIP